MSAKRDISPFLATIRELFLNRKNVNPLRFRDEIAARTQPPPKLPEGPHAKLSSNYYYSRDARNQVKPDTILVEGSTVLKLPEGGNKPTSVLQRVPGKVTNWDI